MINEETNKLIALEYIKKQRAFLRRPLVNNSDRNRFNRSLDKIEALIINNEPKGISVIRIFHNEVYKNYGRTNSFPQLNLYNDIVIKAITDFKKSITIDTLDRYISLAKTKNQRHCVVTNLMLQNIHTNINSSNMISADINIIMRYFTELFNNENIQRYIEENY